MIFSGSNLSAIRRAKRRIADIGMFGGSGLLDADLRERDV